jgi:DNA-binding CsgD family transcriptional regulator
MKRAILGLAPAMRRKTASLAVGERALRFRVRTASRSYQIRATTLAAAFGFDNAIGVAWVEIPTRRQLDDSELSDLFGLTHREAEVARCLAAGCSNADVATSLGITVHTVRRHVERVFQKLAVRTRASVGAKLRGDEEIS